MEADNTNAFFMWIVYIGLAAIALTILWYIISSATRSKAILKFQRMQVELLQEIALKHGVDEKRVNEIISFHNKE